MSRKIDLDTLQMHAPALSQKIADCFAESAAVSLDLQSHATGANIDVDCDNKTSTVEVVWSNQVTPQIRIAHGDDTVRVGNGACAIALLILSEVEGLRAVRLALKWSGVDYFLTPTEQIASADFSDPLIFNYTAVAEITGIQVEKGTNTVDYRINKKVKRVSDYEESSDHKTIDATSYYCVVEFGQPRSKTVRK